MCVGVGAGGASAAAASHGAAVPKRSPQAEDRDAEAAVRAGAADATLRAGGRGESHAG